MPDFWKEKGVSVSRLEEERVLSIFMVPVYGEDTKYINWIQICRRNKAGRAGFAMSKMVARTHNLPSKFLPLCYKTYHHFNVLLNSVCICVALLVLVFIIL